MSDRLTVTLPEWRSEEVEGIALSPEDRRVVRQLADQDRGRLQVDELREGIRVRSTSWVGVVELSQIQIKIVPKLAGNALGLARMLDLTMGLDALKRFPGARTLLLEGVSLFDLLAYLLTQATTQLIRRGLLTDYVEFEEPLPAVRGRVLWDRQLLNRFGRLDRIECRFDDRTHDIPENQVIAAALFACLHRVSHPVVKRAIHRQFAVFAPAARIPRAPLDVHRSIAYNRLNAHYEEGHAYAQAILRNLAVDDPLAGGKSRSYAFMLDMNVLFEQLVYEAVRWLFRGSKLLVEHEAVHDKALWDPVNHRAHAKLKPDVTVFGSRTAFPLDAKYKLYDEKKVVTSDLYQTLTYGLAYTAKDQVARAALIYPTSWDHRPQARVQLRRRDSIAGEVEVFGIFIPRLLEEMEDDDRQGLTASLLRNVIVRSGGFVELDVA